jgi:hypothetical protein
MKYAAILQPNVPLARGYVPVGLQPTFIPLGDEKELTKYIRNGGKYTRIIRYEEVKVDVSVKVN